MTEYICKQDAVDAIHEFPMFMECNEIYIYQKRIEKIPAADVVPVRHGTWLPIVSYNNTYKCSECGRLLVDITDGLKMVAKNYPYCHCGAKMDGKE